MPTDHIVALLVAERDKLNRAIEALQGSGVTHKPHSAPAEAVVKASAANGRSHMSAASREAVSKRMKAYWAKRRAAAGK